MTPDPAREIDKIVARLDRENRDRPKDTRNGVVRCPQHGAQWSCGPPPYQVTSLWSDKVRMRYSCAHIACRQIHAGHCPECETP